MAYACYVAYIRFEKDQQSRSIKVYVPSGHFEVHGYGDTTEIYYDKIPTTVLVGNQSIEFISMDSLKKPITNISFFENERLTMFSLDSVKFKNP